MHSRNHCELSAASECICTFQNEDIFVILNMSFITQFKIQNSFQPKKSPPVAAPASQLLSPGQLAFLVQVY